MRARNVKFESLRRALAGNIIGRILQIISATLAAILLARMLGPEGLGVVAIISSAVRMATMPVLEGASKMCERELAGAIGKGDRPQARAALRFNVYASVVITLLGGAGSVYFLQSSVVFETSGSLGALLSSSIALLLVSVVQSAVRGVVRGEGQTAASLIPVNVTALLIPVYYLLWVWLVGLITVPVAIWLQVAAQVTTFPLWLSMSLRYWPGNLQPGPVRRIPARWIGESVQFTLLGLVSIALMEVGTLFLGYFGTPEEAGIFRVATRVFMIASFVNFAAQRAVGPRVAMLYQKGDKEALVRPARLISLIALVFSTASFLAFALLGRWLIDVTFGPDFRGAYMPSLIVSLGAITSSFGAVSGRILKMTGEQYIVTVGAVLGLAIAVALNFALVPSYGANGCAVALLVATTTARVIHNFGVRRKLGFNPLPGRQAVSDLRQRGLDVFRRRRKKRKSGRP